MKKQLFWVIAALCVVAIMGVSVPRVVDARAQTNFENIQVLTDISDTDIRQLMTSWGQQLGGVSCIECHVQGDFASDENPKKLVARNMARMVKSLNENFFAEVEREADCYLCHQGSTEIPEM